MASRNAERSRARSHGGTRLSALVALFLLGIFAPSFVLLGLLWSSLAERHELAVAKRGLEQTEAIQTLQRGVALEIELCRAQAVTLPRGLAELGVGAPLRLRDDGTLLPFEREALRTELEEDALLLGVPAWFDAVREEQRGAFAVAVLHYSRALAGMGAETGAATGTDAQMVERIQLAMARALHRAGRDAEALAALDKLERHKLSRWAAWESARLRLVVVGRDGSVETVLAARRVAHTRLEALRPELGLLEYLSLVESIGSSPGSASGSASGRAAGPALALQLYRFLAAERDRWRTDPEACLTWPEAPGGAAVFLLSGPDEVEPQERSIRIVPRQEILDAALARAGSFGRLFQIADARPAAGVEVLQAELAPLDLTLALTERDPIPAQFWGDAQARFLFGLAALTLCGLALGLWASLRAVAKESRLALMRADFISSVSHELKTPLTSLRLYSDLLLSPDKDPNKTREYQERIREETQKLTQLVANVLDASRIEAGREYHMEPVDLAELVRGCVQTFEARAQARGASLAATAAAPSWVMGDREALEQVLANLLDNAIKYGGSRISVELDACMDRDMARAVDRDPARVELRVKDDGPGIPRSQRARLFEAYERGSEHGPGAAPGSGLGLAIARDIVHAHRDAQIEIEDLETGGMSMRLSFPALAAADQMMTMTMTKKGEEARA